MQTRLFRHLLAAIAAFLLLGACGDGDNASSISSADSILRHVPADTPYVFATTGEVPDDVADKLSPHVDTTLSAYHRILRAAIEADYVETQAGGEDVEWLENVLPLLDELESLMSVDGLAAAGVDRDSQFAMYGAGLLPVLRIELSDRDAMSAEIDRLEEKAGYAMETASIGNQAYRYAGNDEARIVLALVEEYLVLTFVPGELTDEQFLKVLGVTAPVESLAASGALTAMADEHAFHDYAAGYIDLQGLTRIFTEPQSGINGELLGMMDHDPSELSAVCRSELVAVSGIMPRILMGYTELSVEEISSKAIVELREDIASAVAALAAPVPGLGTPQQGLMSFGMGLDLLALRNFYSERLDALEEAPYECELLADFQDGVAGGRALLNQPIPPIAYSFKGFLAVIESIDGLDIATQQPPTSVEMKLLIATENADGLLAMGAMFSPQLAAMEIEPGGEPIRLSLPQTDALGQVVYLALSEDALAISVGEGMQDGLTDLLQTDASNAKPFVYSDMDASAYNEFVNRSMTADAQGIDEIEGVAEAIADLNASSAALMDRVRFAVTFTEKGIEINSEMTLHD